MNDNPRTDDEKVREQYRDASKLKTRIDLHQRFSTDHQPWQRWVFDQFDLPDDARILEIGCGPARLWTENHDRIPPDWAITLTDASQKILSEARDNINLDLSNTMNFSFTFICTDARSLPFDEAEFDAVISNHMLYHIPDRERIFTEVRRVLKPDGVYFAATNGERNMEEMARFRRILNSKYRVGDESRAFNLENGEEQLKPYFSQVALQKREDGLRITEAKPFVDYLLSMMDIRDEPDFDERVSELMATVEGEIRSRGSLDITKSVGMFIAKV